jgi:hypothetical protein
MTRGGQPYLGGERRLLLDWLEFQRETLALKCADLGAADLERQSLPSSTLSLARLLRHLADMEHLDAAILSGMPVRGLYHQAAVRSGPEDAEHGMYDWSLYDVHDDARAVWRQACDRLSLVIAGFGSLEGRAPDPYGALTVRSVLLALVMEYARHNGHADLLRERIDGTVGY